MTTPQSSMSRSTRLQITGDHRNKKPLVGKRRSAFCRPTFVFEPPSSALSCRHTARSTRWCPSEIVLQNGWLIVSRRSNLSRRADFKSVPTLVLGRRSTRHGLPLPHAFDSSPLPTRKPTSILLASILSSIWPSFSVASGLDPVSPDRSEFGVVSDSTNQRPELGEKARLGEKIRR